MNDEIPVFLYKQRETAGFWEIGGPYGLRFAVEKRPNWWHRFWMVTLLGIKWYDGQP